MPWARSHLLISLANLRWRPWQVEVIIHFVIDSVWNFDHRILNIELGIKVVLVELLKLVLRLLNWVSILICGVLTFDVLRGILLLDSIPSLNKLRVNNLNSMRYSIEMEGHLQPSQRQVLLVSWQCGLHQP